MRDDPPMHDEMGDRAADLDPHPCIRVGLDTLKFSGLDQAIISIEASCPTTKGLNRPQGAEGPRRAKVHKPDATSPPYDLLPERESSSLSVP